MMLLCASVYGLIVDFLGENSAACAVESFSKDVHFPVPLNSERSRILLISAACANDHVRVSEALDAISDEAEKEDLLFDLLTSVISEDVPRMFFYLYRELNQKSAVARKIRRSLSNLIFENDSVHLFDALSRPHAEPFRFVPTGSIASAVESRSSKIAIFLLEEYSKSYEGLSRTGFCCALSDNNTEILDLFRVSSRKEPGSFVVSIRTMEDIIRGSYGDFWNTILFLGKKFRDAGQEQAFFNTIAALIPKRFGFDPTRDKYFEDFLSAFPKRVIRGACSMVPKKLFMRVLEKFDLQVKDLRFSQREFPPVLKFFCFKYVKEC